MEVRIYTSALAYAGRTENYEKLRFTTCFRNAGECELTVPVGVGIADALSVGAYIFIPEESEMYVIVKSIVKYSTGIVKAYGIGILSILGDRIVDQPYSWYGTAAEVLRTMALTFAGDAYPASLSAETLTGGDVIRVYTADSYGNLLTEMTNASIRGGVGMKMQYLTGSGYFKYSTKIPRDCTAESGDGATVLSPECGVMTLETLCDFSNYKNRAIVYGREQTEGCHDYYSVTVDSDDYSFGDGYPDASESVREIYVNATAFGTGPYETRNSDGTVTFDESGYLDALRRRGLRALMSHRPRESRSASVTGSLAERICVGDKCTLRCRDYSGNVLVTEKETVIDGNGKKYAVMLVRA